MVAASAGNHAQGVALAAQLLGIKATVFMPLGAPMPKLVATRAYGAQVEQIGHTIDDCLVRRARVRRRDRRRPDPPVRPPRHRGRAGHGRPGDPRAVPGRRHRSWSAPAAAGCWPGIATAVKAKRPDVRVIGVQAETAAAYPPSLVAGRPGAARPRWPRWPTASRSGCPARCRSRSCASWSTSIVTVTEEMLSRALLFLLERAKLVVEPAGAAAVAALLDRARPPIPAPVVAVLSGGNIDPLLLLRVLRHGMAAAGRYLQFRVRVPDRPGRWPRLLADARRRRRQRARGRARPDRRHPGRRRGGDRGAAGDQGGRALRAPVLGDAARAGLPTSSSPEPHGSGWVRSNHVGRLSVARVTGSIRHD